MAGNLGRPAASTQAWGTVLDPRAAQARLEVCQERSKLAIYLTLRIHGEEWEAYEADNDNADRRWSVQALSERNALKITSFCAPLLDAAVATIKHGRP